MKTGKSHIVTNIIHLLDDQPPPNPITSIPWLFLYQLKYFPIFILFSIMRSCTTFATHPIRILSSSVHHFRIFSYSSTLLPTLSILFFPSHSTIFFLNSSSHWADIKNLSLHDPWEDYCQNASLTWMALVVLPSSHDSTHLPNTFLNWLLNDPGDHWIVSKVVLIFVHLTLLAILHHCFYLCLFSYFSSPVITEERVFIRWGSLLFKDTSLVCTVKKYNIAMLPHYLLLVFVFVYNQQLFLLLIDHFIR